MLHFPIRLIVTIWLSVLLASCAHNEMNTAYQWRNVQITGGGFVPGIISHPTEKELRYARTDMGGAYRWEESEKRWTPLLDWISYEDYNLMGVESIALNPQNHNDLFLACGTYTRPQTPEGAILISNDRGKTFKRVDVPFKMGGNENGRGNGERMMVDPYDENVIYLGTRHAGLWRSSNKGREWHQVTSFPDVTEFDEPVDRREHSVRGGSGIVFVLFDPSSGKNGGACDVIYVGVSLMGRSNLFRTNNGGETWEEVPGHPQQYRPTQGELASDGSLFITYADNSGPRRMTNGGVWKFDAATGFWEEITPCKPDGQNGRGFGYAALSVDAGNPQHLVVTTHYRPGSLGGEEIFRSIDGGNTWTEVFKSGVRFDYSKAPYVKHTPVHWMFDVEINPNNPDHLIFTTGYGGHETYNLSDVSTPQEVVWHIMATGIEETVALELHSPSKGAHILTAIGDYCGFAHYDLDRPVAEGCFENPHFSNTSGIVSAELRPEIVVRTGRASHHIGGAHIGYSMDYGNTWQPCNGSPGDESMYGHIAVSSDGTTWVWTPNREVPHVTRDNGNTWQEIPHLPVNTRVVADRVNPDLFYAMNLLNGRFFISYNGAETFRESNLPDPLTIAHNTYRGDPRGGQDRLYVVPGFEGNLWLAAFDGLYFSQDYGTNWLQIHEIEELHAFGFGRGAPQKEHPSLFMVGVINGLRGIYRSDDYGESWVRINDDQNQWGLVLHITGDPKRYGRAYVGTHGRGTFYGDVPE